jgi:wobble nucleotide-excising tRNase
MNKEKERIFRELAEAGSKFMTGKTIKERVDEKFSEISQQEYEAAEKVWDDLYRRRRELYEELQKVNQQIVMVEKIICQPIKKEIDKTNRPML